MTAEEFEKSLPEEKRWTLGKHKFAEAYAKHENSYAILAIDEFKKENEDLQNQLGLAKSVEAELRKTIGKFKPLQKQVDELKGLVKEGIDFNNDQVWVNKAEQALKE
jgi:hypothetical protein